MSSDSASNAAMALASSNRNSKDCAKKKRAQGHRSAKLKQCKLDARRDQWLSQVKINCPPKEEVIDGVGTRGSHSVHSDNERGHQSLERLEIKLTSMEENYGDGSLMHQYSDFESWPGDSPASYTSSALCSNNSGMNFTDSARYSSQSSIGSINGFFSSNVSEDNEGDQCLDDWEAVADALASTYDKQKEHRPELGSHSLVQEKHANTLRSVSGAELSNRSFTRVEITKSKRESGGASTRNCQAWRHDDAYRPQGLPSLSRQYNLPLNAKRQFSPRARAWGRKVVRPGISTPWPMCCEEMDYTNSTTSCPICCEDLDFTDSLFKPCSCGYQLCLFCHKRILEEDGRCPGCRNQYEITHVEGEATLIGGSLTFQVAHSCSMTSRS